MLCLNTHKLLTGFPGGSVANNPTCSAGDAGSIPEFERSPGQGNGNPLQYSCQANLMDRGAWQSMGCKESDTTEHCTVLDTVENKVEEIFSESFSFAVLLRVLIQL